MSFFMDNSKEQGDSIPSPDGFEPGMMIVSPDTRRADRIPPGQSRTKKWPVLDASGPPHIDLAQWTLRVSGLVEKPVQWTWKEFLELPRVRVFSDFHCVTRWSRLGNIWEGVSTAELLRLAGGPKPEAAFVTAHGYDRAFTTNLPLADLLAEDVLVAITHDGQPISTDHGGPARLIVPRLYAWKSAKWLSAIQLTTTDRAGFWESNGYHMRGDPWQEERYGW
jgi:DMSO/TMAO reductase YedYZ molybdopterin-dependent catalytic subunit